MNVRRVTTNEVDRAMRAYLGECCNAGETRKAMESRLKKFAGDRLELLKPQLDLDLGLVVGCYKAVAKFDPLEDFDRALDQAFEVVTEVISWYTTETRRKMAIYCVYDACKTK
jgi:hypothetical protein